MLEMLQEYQKMTFIWAEISYFSKWYDNLKSEDSREMVCVLFLKISPLRSSFRSD